MSVVNEIYPFAAEASVDLGEVLTLTAYHADMQRLRGNQPGIARSALVNTVLRQTSHIAAGLAQFIANRYAAGVKDDGDLDAIEAGLLSAITSIVSSVTDPFEAELAALDALRKRLIGIPLPWRSTTLPPNHVWADGSLVLFEDWPELEEIYNAGGLSGLLLAWDADEETIAANIGKWRPNSANPTGLFVPSLGGQFSRAWVSGQSADAGREAGSVQSDAVQSTWTSMVIKPMSADDSPVGVKGVTITRGETTGRLAYEGAGIVAQSFVATNEQRQADETRAVNVAIPYVIYLGLTI